MQHKRVAVRRGSFSVNLGALCTIPGDTSASASCFAAHCCWISWDVVGREEPYPRYFACFVFGFRHRVVVGVGVSLRLGLRQRFLVIRGLVWGLRC